MASTIIVEIRAAVGGMDSKLLVLKQFAIYGKYAVRKNFNLVLLEERPGFLSFRAEGAKAVAAFAHEAGGHRVQRVPPTEKRGRVHTSTITIATLQVPKAADFHLDPRDLEWKTCRGSGAGGQHRNTTDSAVQLTHRPSRTAVRVESERSQHANREAALELLRARLKAEKDSAILGARNATRKSQVGRGSRSGKRRTIRLQADQVVDHVTGKRMSAKRYLRGYIEDLW